MAWLRWRRLKFDVCLGAEGIGRCSRVLWWWSQRITGIVRQAPHQKHVHNEYADAAIPNMCGEEYRMRFMNWNWDSLHDADDVRHITHKSCLITTLICCGICFPSQDVQWQNDAALLCFYVEVAKQHSKVGRSRIRKAGHILRYQKLIEAVRRLFQVISYGVSGSNILLLLA